MQVKEFFNNVGWRKENCKGNVGPWANVDITFYNPVDKCCDETEFTIPNAFTSEGVAELDELFSDFCKENNIRSKEVCDIRVVMLAASEKELLALESGN